MERSEIEREEVGRGVGMTYCGGGACLNFCCFFEVPESLYDSPGKFTKNLECHLTFIPKFFLYSYTLFTRCLSTFTKQGSSFSAAL